MSSTPPSRVRSLLRAGCASLAVALGLVVAEGALRVRARAVKPPPGPTWNEHDERLGWRNRRSFTLVADPATNPLLPCRFTVKLDARGVRDAGARADVPPAGTARLAFLGDSFTFGVGVEGEDAFPARVEAALAPRGEAWNWGVGGYGVDQCLLQLERDVLPTRPAVVVLAAIEHDLQRATTALWLAGARKPRYRLDGETLALEGVPVPEIPAGATYLKTDTTGLLLLGRLADAARGARRSLASDPYTAEERWPLGRAIVREAARRARAAGARLLFVALPELHVLGKDPLERFARELDLEAEGGAVLAVHDAFRARPDPSSLFLKDGHPNQDGHALIAAEIVSCLGRKGFLPR